METLKGFPNLPALWLRWAKPTSANAVASLPYATPITRLSRVMSAS
jgi:hypothetical protein